MLGGKEFFTRYSPVVCVEVWNEEKLKLVEDIFQNYGYKLKERLQKWGDDYVFVKG